MKTPTMRIFGDIEDLAGQNTTLAVTGVSRGAFLEDSQLLLGGAVTSSLVLRSTSGTLRFLRTEHFFDKVTGLAPHPRTGSFMTMESGLYNQSDDLFSADIRIPFSPSA